MKNGVYMNGENGGAMMEENMRPMGEAPAAKAEAPAAPGAGGARSRLFGGLSEIVKEIEGRRAQRSLTVSLQRQVKDLRDQLQKTREKSAALAKRASLIPELEEARRMAQLRISAYESSRKESDGAMGELRVRLEATRSDLENARRQLNETALEFANRKRLMDKLSRELTEKEMTVSKSLAVIRRFEEDRGRASPKPTAAGLDKAGETPRFTTDDPPPAPPYLEPRAEEGAPASNALSAILGRIRKNLEARAS